MSNACDLVTHLFKTGSKLAGYTAARLPSSVYVTIRNLALIIPRTFLSGTGASANNGFLETQERT
jgi:hypothetical protein